MLILFYIVAWSNYHIQELNTLEPSAPFKAAIDLQGLTHKLSFNTQGHSEVSAQHTISTGWYRKPKYTPAQHIKATSSTTRSPSVAGIPIDTGIFPSLNYHVWVIVMSVWMGLSKCISCGGSGGSGDRLYFEIMALSIIILLL